MTSLPFGGGAIDASLSVYARVWYVLVVHIGYHDSHRSLGMPHRDDVLSQYALQTVCMLSVPPTIPCRVVQPHAYSVLDKSSPSLI